nr:immunoglobulin light chain junction region [Macaca mulatta]
RMIWHNNVVLF